MPGTLLVVGSAPCLFDDVERAFSLRPLAAVMLVNGACTALEHAEHVLSGHSYKAEEFAAARRKKFPGSSFLLHATITQKHLAEAGTVFPSVTTWWDKSFCHGATSISKATDIGLRGLGFDEVILCGAPLDGSGYFPGEYTKVIDCLRIGDATSHTGWGPKRDERHRVIEGYRSKFKKFVQIFPDRIFSMSGFTHDVVGEPKR